MTGNREYRDYKMRAHFTGLAASGGAGPGKNNATAIGGLPIATFTAPLTDSLVLTYVAANGQWEAKPNLVPANPTAVAGDIAINGVALTYMRSDAAPAIQKGSAAQYGIIKVDGTTITAIGGVISAVPSGGGGSMLPLVNGDLPGPAAISDDKGQYIGVPL